MRIITCFWVAVLICSLIDRPALGQSKPNVLFIAIDDLRDWVGYLKGHPQTQTPNLDRLAGRGVAFSHAYCAAPVCNPSRAALMSGLRPSTTGVYENNNDWRTVIPPEKCLTTTFRNAGYWVGGAGKIYHESYKRRSEWDDYMESLGKMRKTLQPKGDGGVGGIRFGALDCKDQDLPDYQIASWVIDRLNQKHEKPFFLACGFHKPHMPWNVPQKWFDMFPLDKIILPPYLENDLDDVPPAGVKMAKPQRDHAAILQSGRWKEAVQAYLATIAYCDMNVGRVIDALDKSPYRENTIICLWSDHGWHLGEKQHWRKFALWEPATRSPFLFVVPGLTRAGGTCDRAIDYMSIYPTLTDLCGIPTPSHVEGKSLRPLLADPNASWTSPAVTTYLFKNHSVRSDEWRYIRYANGDEELYDETGDPNEWKNLAKESQHADKKAELAAHIPKTNAPDIGGAKGAGAEEGESAPKTRKTK